MNALLICNNIQAAVSIGNDGFIKCWMLDDDCNDTFLERRIWSVNVTDCILLQQQEKEETKTPIKLTASCLYLEQQDHAILGIGTACGKVLLATITKSLVGDGLSVSLLDKWITVESSSSSSSSETREGGGCTIHSLASQNNHIAIGHSEGISIWHPLI